MARNHVLSVWLDDVEVAELAEPRSRQLSLRHTDEAVARHGVGALLISASLPVRSAPYSVGACLPVLEGILPEGEARTRIERQLGVPRGDSFRLLREIGRDCAGALVILAPHERPVRELGDVVPLTNDDVERELDDLTVHPLGVTGDVRLSLAGMMDKLLLTQLPDGGWGCPVGGAPSTHILKPEPERFPGLATLEAFGLRLAGAAGLRTAHADVVPGRTTVTYLAVTRYDRQRGSDGSVRRIHQEDLCQATGTLEKYEADGGPSFADVAAILRRFSTALRDDLADLVRIMTTTVAVGNADAHGRNLSMLYDRGSRRLAPLYDVVPTTSLVPPPGGRPVHSDAAMTVNGVRPLTTITGADLTAEARTWRVPTALVDELVVDTVDAIRDRAGVIAHELGVPARVLGTILHRCDELRGSLRS